MNTLLVDGSNVLMRAVHAMKSQNLTAPDGTPTGGLMVFINLLNRAVKTTKPDKVLVLWDVKGGSFRNQVVPSYKANRPAATTDYADDHYSLAREYCVMACIPQFWSNGYEADDLIAAYVMRNDELEWGEDIVIVSGDKDMHQLINDNVSVLLPDGSLIDHGTFRDKHEHHPRHIANLKALTGDPSDNIEGLKGIGPKRARKLMEENDWDMSRLLADHPESDTIRANLRVIDLTGTEGIGVTERMLSSPKPEVSEFDPVLYNEGEWQFLAAWLKNLGLDSILADYISGRMWGRSGEVVQLTFDG